MAILRLRTNITLILVLVNFFVQTHSDSEVRPQNYAIDDIRVDTLLRGSGEERNGEIEEDSPYKTTNKNIEPERSFRQNEKAISDQKDSKTDDYEETLSQKTTKDNLDYRTTTEVSTTDYIPEALGLTNLEVKELNDYFDVNKKIVLEEQGAGVTAMEMTETATDATLSTLDNTVYRKVEDIDSNVNNDNIIVGPKAETTVSGTATTRAMDDMEVVGARTLGLDEDAGLSGQIKPKTENLKSDNWGTAQAVITQAYRHLFPAELKSQIDERYYETKSMLQPPASKSSTLKSWLEDSWLRPPAGLLVPLRPMALNRALAVWNDLTVDRLNVSDIVIIGYDSNGVNWRSRHNLQPSSSGTDRTVSEALSKLLLKYQGVNTDATNDGTMRALTSAAKLVPYDSALFVLTDKGAGDPARLPLALRALVEKRLKVYTIWTDPNHPSNESEQQLQELRNISRHTEGDVLPYSLQVMEMDPGGNSASELQLLEPVDVSLQSRRPRVNTLVEYEKYDTLLVQRGGGEAISLGVPVENGVTALRIFIEGLVEHAVLYPPNDAQIDLYNVTSVLAFSPASRTDGLTPRDVYLAFPGHDTNQDMLSVLPMSSGSPAAPAPTVGVWHLSVRCDTCDYRLCVTARALIHFHALVESKDKLRMRVTGPVASVRESVLIDEYGTELAKLPFSYQPIAGDGRDRPSEGPPSELIADVALPSVKGSRVYAKIVGRDIRGEPFFRLSGPLNQQEVRTGRSAAVASPDPANDLERAEATNSRVYNQRLQYNDSNVLPFNRAVSQVVNQRGSLLTAVQIGLSTRLYGAPGDILQLHFEVTNFREQAVRFTFEAVGELRFLRGINPNAQNILSGQTANVIVTVGITATAQPGARDLITFTAYGVEQVSISAYVYVVNSGDTTADVWAPELRHNFQGSCIGRLGSDCAQHTWSATVIARDAMGGLLRLSSTPIGLVYDSNFIAGSREEVVATYRATCCAPRVIVTAVDAFGNANSYAVDISNYFTAAGIASIVLGVFLLIAIILLVVFLIYWCVKRRRESRELPSYTTSSSRNIS